MENLRLRLDVSILDGKNRREGLTNQLLTAATKSAARTRTDGPRRAETRVTGNDDESMLDSDGSGGAASSDRGGKVYTYWRLRGMLTMMVLDTWEN